jgi:TatD DNase family protein
LLGEDLSTIIARAEDNGVQYMQTICTTLEELPTILEITVKYGNIFASCGIHPNEVKEIAMCETIVDYSNHPKIIGIGETGLDYYYQTSDKNKQIGSFEQHIQASQSTGLPIIVHTREAEEDTIDILAVKCKMHHLPVLFIVLPPQNIWQKKCLTLVCIYRLLEL